MGNCIHVLSCNSHKKIKVLPLNCGEKEGYKSLTSAEPYSSLPQGTKLEPRKVYYLVPAAAKSPLRSSVPLKMAKQGSSKRERVKIVITRQQLEFLLGNANKLRSGKVSVRFSESFTLKKLKWHTSLATIPEMPNF